MNVFAKAKIYLRRCVAAVLGLLAFGLLFWAGALLLLQCTTWLATGIWQPVPVSTVLLSPQAQAFNLRSTDGEAPTDAALTKSMDDEAILKRILGHDPTGAYRPRSGRLTPLDLAPSWAAFDSPDAVAASAAGNMVGLARIIRYLLNIPLGFCLVALAVASWFAAALLAYWEPTSGTSDFTVQSVQERQAGRLTPSQAFLAFTFGARFQLAVVLTLTCIAGSIALLDWLEVPSGALWWDVVFGVDALMAVGIWFVLCSIALHYMPRGGRSLTPRD